MYAQQNKFKELLDKYGWELIETRIPEDRFIAEIWMVKSTWSPIDCSVAIDYVVDPQWTDSNKKHLGVWAVALSLTQLDYKEEVLPVNLDSKFGFHNRESIKVAIRPN